MIIIKLSVIIPVFNGEKTIERCIDSILNQTLGEIEIIAVNDGSADATGEILKRYGNKIKVITINHGGQGIARNAGMDAASGKYIGFVDADDYIEKEMYSEMYARAEKNGAQAVQCGVAVVENGLKRPLYSVNEHLCVITKKDEYFGEYLFSNKHSYECCNKIFLAEFLRANNIRFEANSRVYAEDLLFNLDAALALERVYFIPQTYYNYVSAPCSHSKTHTAERVMQVYELFNIFYAKVNDRKLACQVSKIAVLIIFLYLAQVLNTDSGYVTGVYITRQRQMRKYVREAAAVMKKLHHKIIMVLILALPSGARLRLIEKYYLNMK